MANVVKALSSFRGHFPALDEPSLHVKPSHLHAGWLPSRFPCSSLAIMLPLARVWTGGCSCCHTTPTPELLDPSQRHCLAFSGSMADPFCTSRSKACLALALRSEPACEPVLWGCSCSMACHQLGTFLNGSRLQSACNAFKNKEQHMHSNQTYIFPVLQLFICPCSKGFSDVAHAARPTRPFCPHCLPPPYIKFK